MWCIKYVQYKVLINGWTCGQIIPKRYFRQDDPLLPYLFILCTKALIANIRKAEREKSLRDYELREEYTPLPPLICNLVFEDDSLFPVRPIKRNVRIFFISLNNMSLSLDNI